MKYQAYAEYKDSGEKWLGDIPSQWVIFEGKRIFKNRRELATDIDEQLAASQKYGVIPQSLMMELNDSKVMLALKGTNSFRHVKKNDFVISLRSFEGGIEHSNYDGCVSPAYTVLKATKNIEPRFYRYLFKSNPFIAALQSSTDSLRDGKSITFEQFGTIPLVLPPTDEQQTIANFLDHETAKIDTLIKKQQQLIQLLKEKRQAVISHAVTKGLNPNAPMRDSGVEWLGEVPEHWVVMPIKRMAELNPKKSEVEKEKHKKCNFVPMEKLKTDSLTLDEVRLINDVYDGYTYFKDDDVLMAKVTPCFENKNIAIAKGMINGIGFGSSEIYVLRVNETVVNDFLHYRIQEDSFMEIATSTMTGAGGLKRVPAETINNFTIALPPISEQKAIVTFIKDYLVKFDALVINAHGAISLLKERRTALISAVVTGKIDVRSWQSPEPLHNNKETNKEEAHEPASTYR